MRIKKFLALFIVFTCIAYVLFMIIILYSMGGGTLFGLPEYYSTDKNYKSITMQIKELREGDDYLCIYADHNNKDFDSNNKDFDSGFIVLGKNFEAIKNSGFLEEVHVGDTIIIAAAPGYFGDGWMYPVIAIEYNDTVYLERSVGKQNLVGYYEQNNELSAKFYAITLPIFGFSLAVAITSLILFIKVKKPISAN